MTTQNPAAKPQFDPPVVDSLSVRVVALHQSASCPTRST